MVIGFEYNKDETFASIMLRNGGDKQNPFMVCEGTL